MRHSIFLILATLTLISACVAQPNAGTSGSVARTPLGAQLDSALAQAESEGFSGVALVEKDGQIVLKKGYGMANRAKAIPMSPSTVVQIGSNTKDFTAVAILQLVERDRLKLNDSIGKFLLNVPSDKRGVTIVDLLKHRAGFPQHLGADFDAVTREQMIRNALGAPLLFPPGQGRSYSNVGYSLLGAIIEQLSGKSYDQYVHDEILEPAGLKETGFLLPRFDSMRVAHGYRGDEDRGTMLAKPHASDGPYWNLRANGGMLSTVDDMHRFYKVLAGEKLLKAATRDVMFTPNTPVVLAGSDMVNFFLYNREPQAGVTMILASNSTGLNAPRARDRLAPHLGLRGGGAQREIVTQGPGERRTASPTKAALMDLPNTPAGNTVRAFLRAYNSGDLTAMRDFIRESVIQATGDKRTLDERLSGHQRIRKDLGTLDLLGVESAAAERIVTRLAAAKGDTVTMIFDIESQPPHRIRGIRVEAQ